MLGRLGRHGVGVEAIDRQAAAELSIRVVYTSSANGGSVARQGVTFMIVLPKWILESDRAIRAGNWEARRWLRGVEVKGKMLGWSGSAR